MAELGDYEFTNEGPSHTFSYLREALLTMLNKNSCILDLGCGNGHLVNYLNSIGYDAYGIDASATGIAIARKTNQDRFFLQDISSGKLPHELQEINFNSIVCTEVIEHLYDPEEFIRLCKSTLPKGGELIISTPYHGYLKNLVLSISNKWDKHWMARHYGGHIKFWSRKTLTRLLTENGFMVTDFKGCGRLPLFWKSMVIKARLT